MGLARRPRILLMLVMMLGGLLALGSAARAQQGTAHAGYVFPAGGRQGTTFFVTIGGQTLDGVNEVYISGGGAKGTVVEHTKPLTPKQVQLYKDDLDALQEKRAAANGVARPATTGPATRPVAASAPTTRPVWTAEDEKRLMEVRKQLQNRPNRQMNQAISETVTVEVTLDAGAALGQRELRLGTTAGLSNPLVFCVGQLPEVMEKNLRATTQPALALPAVVNGQIMPGEVDRFRISGKKGQKVVFETSARALIPYLSDAVPGWFQAAVTLYDAKGREVGYADHYQFSPDPVMCFDVPADGEYTVEIRDDIYRGREDFVYRLAIGELPYITGIFPLGTKAGTQAGVEVMGWNLGTNKAAFDARKKAAGVYSMAVQGGGMTSNAVPFAVDSMAEMINTKQNDRVDAAVNVSLPVIVNGRIERAGEWNVYSFSGHAGQQIVAEVRARRLDSPLDSVLKLTDAAGKQLAFNDDNEDKGAGMDTHYADSYLRATLPADGTYYVHIGDAQQKSGVEYGYRLRISEPQPDFALRVTPSSISLRAGASVPVTVYALRKDGFSDEIPLSLKDAPAGFGLSGGKIPANQEQVKLTLKAPGTHFDEPVTLTFEGRAKIGGQEVVRAAVPAEDMMQAFAYHHLVAQRELMVDVLTRLVARNEVKIVSGAPVSIAMGGTATVVVGMPTTVLAGKLDLELNDAPEGISIQSVSATKQGTEMVLRCDAAKAKAGLKGNLIVTIVLERDAPAGAAGKAGAKRRVPAGSLPAIPYEIMAK